jgi:hypothetical protein
MSQPRPNADQAPRRFSASARSSLRWCWNSALSGVCLGAGTADPSNSDGRPLSAGTGRSRADKRMAQIDPEQTFINVPADSWVVEKRTFAPGFYAQDG